MTNFTSFFVDVWQKQVNLRSDFLVLMNWASIKEFQWSIWSTVQSSLVTSSCGNKRALIWNFRSMHTKILLSHGAGSAPEETPKDNGYLSPLGLQLLIHLKYEVPKSAICHQHLISQDNVNVKKTILFTFPFNSNDLLNGNDHFRALEPCLLPRKSKAKIYLLKHTVICNYTSLILDIVISWHSMGCHVLILKAALQ